MIYLYAVTDREAKPGLKTPGFEDAAPVAIAYRKVAAVIGRLAAARVPVAEANLWRHEAVVEALMERHAVLPVRFGTVVPDEAAARAILAEGYDGFVANLERVRGHVEVGLRVLWGEQPPPSLKSRRAAGNSEGQARDGTAYLLAKLESERERQAWRGRAESRAASLYGPLAQLAAQSVYRLLVTPRLLLSAAFLVHRSRVARFRGHVERLGARHCDLRLLCTGPWPPYSFVTVRIAPDGEGERRDALL